MTSIQNPWDILGSKFNIHLKKGQIDPRVADNILIAWPSILKLITQEYPNPKRIKVLDFGCGTGGFCRRLNQLGYTVTGIDQSNEMIKTAIAHSPSAIKYILGNQSKFQTLETFDIITSIMTTPFIEELDNVIKSLASKLNQNGIIIIADFNKDWVKECLKIPVSFADFDSNDNPNKGQKTFGDIKIPVFIRDSKEYDNVAKQNGLGKIFEDYPPFTEEFIQKYPDDRPKNNPEYMILGYKK